MSVERKPEKTPVEGPDKPEEKADRRDLKIQALLEKLSQRENEVADLRVELTIMVQELDRLKNDSSEEDGKNPAL